MPEKELCSQRFLGRLEDVLTVAGAIVGEEIDVITIVSAAAERWQGRLYVCDLVSKNSNHDATITGEPGREALRDVDAGLLAKGMTMQELDDYADRTLNTYMTNYLETKGRAGLANITNGQAGGTVRQEAPSSEEDDTDLAVD